MTDAVLLHTDGPVWRLTLNAPDTRNALSLDMVEALHAAFDRVEAETPRGLVITGAGPVFCAGLDLAGIESRSDADMLWLLTRIELMLQRLWSLPCRTLGLAQKAAIGAGADILVCCQHRVLSDGDAWRSPGLASASSSAPIASRCGSVKTPRKGCSLPADPSRRRMR